MVFLSAPRVPRVRKSPERTCENFNIIESPDQIVWKRKIEGIETGG
jgi:hypothetical protein